MRGTIVRQVLYPLNEWREGTHILEQLRSIERSQYAPPEQLRAIRINKLRALATHAFDNVPFYRRRFLDAGITADDIRDFDDLRQLPLLTKDDINGNLSSVTARNISPADIHRSASGGSTGRQTPFYRDNKCLNVKRAAQFRFDRWCGWQVGDKVAYFWPALQDFASQTSFRVRLRNALVDRTLMLPAGNLNDETMARLAKTLIRYAPTLIRAFPNPLAIFAEYLRRSGTDTGVRPRGILTTGEPLLPSQRTLFEAVFGCPVFNCYVSRECGQHACECERHDGLHINAESIHIELERDRQPVADGEPGDVIITDLDNYGMPFIRYRIEDTAVRMSGECACGRTLPRISFQAGRTSDFVVSPADRSLVSGASLCHYLLTEGPNVGQLQIIQDAIDHLTIRLKASATERVNTAHVEAVIAKLFHRRMRVTFERVASIPHEASGKYRFCINRCSPDLLVAQSNSESEQRRSAE